MGAPNKAVVEYNRATSLMKAQNPKEAIKHLQKAIQAYPKFVSAHVALGLAYVDQEDMPHARNEFDAATQLDAKFPGSFLNMGLVALSANDFPAAQTELEKASSLSPKDARILSTLAYAQNGNHHYQDVLQTAKLVHSLNHRGMANVHYVAASAAMSLKDYNAVSSELNLFIGEDPTNPFAPVARQNLAILARHKIGDDSGNSAPAQANTLVASLRPQTLPNTERLKAQLTALGQQSDSDNCEECGTLEAIAAPEPGNSSAASAMHPIPSGPIPFTIRTNVDQEPCSSPSAAMATW